MERSLLATTRRANEVVLNVGGTLFHTSTATLCQEPSYLAGLFSGNFDGAPNAQGQYFIDRDPRFFSAILNYLRTRRFSIDMTTLSELDQELLQCELEFYCIESLLALFGT